MQSQWSSRAASLLILPLRYHPDSILSRRSHRGGQARERDDGTLCYGIFYTTTTNFGGSRRGKKKKRERERERMSWVPRKGGRSRGAFSTIRSRLFPGENGLFGFTVGSSPRAAQWGTRRSFAVLKVMLVVILCALTYRFFWFEPKEELDPKLQAYIDWRASWKGKKVGGYALNQIGALLGYKMRADGTYKVDKSMEGETELDVTNQLGNWGIAALASTLAKNEQIQTLDCRYNAIRFEGAKAIGAMLATNRSLKRLMLGGNDFQGRGAIVIAEGLAQNTVLEHLSLRDCGVRDKGLVFISDALATNNNTAIRELDVGSNHISDSAMASVAVLLAKNKSLILLHLSFNTISDRGVGYVSGGLANATSIKALYLTHNRIGDKGVQSLAEALRVNRSLTQLDLRYNKMTDKGARILLDLLVENENITLETLSLQYNLISDEMITELMNYRGKVTIYINPPGSF